MEIGGSSERDIKLARLMVGIDGDLEIRRVGDITADRWEETERGREREWEREAFFSMQTSLAFIYKYHLAQSTSFRQEDKEADGEIGR